jgi:hypothetical protein
MQEGGGRAYICKGKKLARKGQLLEMVKCQQSYEWSMDRKCICFPLPL